MDMLKNRIIKVMTVFVIAVLLILCAACSHEKQSADNESSMDYREEMRSWVIKISCIAKEINPDFVIMPQNCSPLFTDTGYLSGELSSEFIDAIDGAGQESISFGYEKFNKATDMETQEYLSSLLNLGVENGLTVVSVNYCNVQDKAGSAIDFDKQNGYISFVSPSISLTDIPIDIPLYQNAEDITALSDARNWLFMLNPEKYDTKEEYINALSQTDFDVIVIDAFFYDDVMLTSEDVSRLKTKANGGRRLVISYLSIGEAEDYRYYWQGEWSDNSPEWMLTENPNWEGNYPVEYWNDDWQSIIATAENSYLMRIIDAGFDGVYLDIVDGYETFEDIQ